MIITACKSLIIFELAQSWCDLRGVNGAKITNTCKYSWILGLSSLDISFLYIAYRINQLTVGHDCLGNIREV